MILGKIRILTHNLKKGMFQLVSHCVGDWYPDQLLKSAIECHKEKQAAFQFQIAAESPESLVFTDECTVNLKVVDRLYGWSYHDTCAHMESYFVQGNQWYVSWLLSMADTDIFLATWCFWHCHWKVWSSVTLWRDHMMARSLFGLWMSSQVSWIPIVKIRISPRNMS